VVTLPIIKIQNQKSGECRNSIIINVYNKIKIIFYFLYKREQAYVPKKVKFPLSLKIKVSVE
jgi:hypothetical protein